MDNKFSQRFKELRTERRLSQVETAVMLGVSKGIISLWETGQREPNMSSLIAIAQKFGVSIDYLVGLSDY